VLTLSIYDYVPVETAALIILLKITVNKFMLYAKMCGCGVSKSGGK
jgi:hypothetical protein